VVTFVTILELGHENCEQPLANYSTDVTLFSSSEASMHWQVYQVDKVRKTGFDQHNLLRSTLYKQILFCLGRRLMAQGRRHSYVGNLRCLQNTSRLHLAQGITRLRIA